MITSRSDIGGGPSHVHALISGMKDALCYVAAPSDGYYFDVYAQILGVNKVCAIPRQKFSFFAMLRVVRFCRKHQIDIIHSHGKGAGVYSRLIGVVLNKPVVHTLHGYHDGAYSLLLKKFYAIYENLLSWVTDQVICVSASEAETFKNKTRVSNKKITIVVNGTKVSTEEPAIAMKNKAVTVARFSHQKNLIELIELAKKTPDFKYQIIGGGELQGALKFIVQECDLSNVCFMGMTPHVSALIRDAEVFVSTSLWEGLPLAILEAMSLGIPVVASDVVGNRDAVVSGVTGYLYPLGDLDACVARISDAKQLSRSEIQTYHRANFSSEIMVIKTRKVYEQVLRLK